MSKFLIERYKATEPYVPGEQPRDKRYVKLNTNESPFPPSPKAVGAVNSELIENLRLYSDNEAVKSTSAIAAYYGLNNTNVLVTNGSDEALAFVFAAFCGDKKGIACPDITYGFYVSIFELLDIKPRFIPLKNDFKVDVEAFASANTNIVIANPNAPTGIALSLKEIENIVKGNPDSVVIIDEAYADFGAETAAGLLQSCRNLIIVGTLSKSRSLAGARLGYVLADPDVIADIKKIKYCFNPYNVNSVTDVLAKYAVEDDGYFKSCVASVIETRGYARKRLEKLGFEVLPSKANFLFAKHGGISGEKLYLNLKERGILVRYFDRERLRPFIRISIGSRGDIDAFLTAAEEILKQEALL